MKACIIVIGNEILSGETLDSNSAFLGKQLNEIGIPVVKKISIPDKKEDIFKAIDQAFEVADVVLTSGGLGPTNDDITKQVIAEYFDSEFEHDEFAFKYITELLKQRGRKPQQVHYDMALIPKKAKALRNRLGTASGLMFEENGKTLISMPGVPYELRSITVDEVIPFLKKKNGSLKLINRNIRTVGIYESLIAEKIKHIEDKLPENISLAYLPNLGQVKLRLTATGNNDDELKKQLQKIEEDILEIVGEHVYGFDDVSLEEAIGKILKEKNAFVGTAESCTGGYLAHTFTQHPGSSEYFKGSVVAYSNEIKMKQLQVKQETLEQYGAVSKECIEEMAKGALTALDVDYSIATSGIAGPDGGTEEKPVGTIWIAIASKDEVISEKLQFNRGRLQNIKYTVAMGLYRLWEMVK
jgi:nicotinamide-nucleotide amidase